MKTSTPYFILILRSVLFIIAGWGLHLVTQSSLETLSRWWSVLCVIINIITVMVLIWVCHKEDRSFMSLISNEKEPVKMKETFLLVVLMMVLGMGAMTGIGLLMYGRIPTIMVQPIPIGLAVINVFLLPVTIVFAELPLYFGYALNKIDEHTGKKSLAIGLPMFFYAIQHSFIPLLFDWKHILYRFLAFFPLLIVLGFIYYKRRKLMSMMIGHGVLDFAVAMQILIFSLFPTVYEMI